jgi:hypothetical protein
MHTKFEVNQTYSELCSRQAFGDADFDNDADNDADTTDKSREGDTINFSKTMLLLPAIFFKPEFILPFICKQFPY